MNLLSLIDGASAFGLGASCGRVSSAAVRSLIPGMKCLVKNITGEPRHPLYISADQALIDLQ